MIVCHEPFDHLPKGTGEGKKAKLLLPSLNRRLLYVCLNPFVYLVLQPLVVSKLFSHRQVSYLDQHVYERKVQVCALTPNQHSAPTTPLSLRTFRKNAFVTNLR